MFELENYDIRLSRIAAASNGTLLLRDRNRHVPNRFVLRFEINLSDSDCRAYEMEKFSRRALENYDTDSI